MTYRILSILVMIFMILLSFTLWKGYGILGSCLTIFFTAPVWGSIYMNTSPLSLDIIKADLTSFWTEGFFRIIVLVLFHLLIALTTGRYTCISSLFPFYFVLALLGYSTAYFMKKKDQVYWYGFALAPLLMSLFLILNYHLSLHSVKETYPFVAPTNALVNSYDTDFFSMGPRILLKDHAYTEYPGIRSFWDRESIRGNRITYTFETGFFGVRVVKDREVYTFYK